MSTCKNLFHEAILGTPTALVPVNLRIQSNTKKKKKNHKLIIVDCEAFATCNLIYNKERRCVLMIRTRSMLEELPWLDIKR